MTFISNLLCHVIRLRILLTGSYQLIRFTFKIFWDQLAMFFNCWIYYELNQPDKQYNGIQQHSAVPGRTDKKGWMAVTYLENVSIQTTKLHRPDTGNAHMQEVEHLCWKWAPVWCYPSRAYVKLSRFSTVGACHESKTTSSTAARSNQDRRWQHTRNWECVCDQSYHGQTDNRCQGTTDQIPRRVAAEKSVVRCWPQVVSHSQGTGKIGCRAF